MFRDLGPSLRQLLRVCGGAVIVSVVGACGDAIETEVETDARPGLGQPQALERFCDELVACGATSDSGVEQCEFRLHAEQSKLSSACREATLAYLDCSARHGECVVDAIDGGQWFGGPDCADHLAWKQVTCPIAVEYLRAQASEDACEWNSRCGKRGAGWTENCREGLAQMGEDGCGAALASFQQCMLETSECTVFDDGTVSFYLPPQCTALPQECQGDWEWTKAK